MRHTQINYENCNTCGHFCRILNCSAFEDKNWNFKNCLSSSQHLFFCEKDPCIFFKFHQTRSPCLQTNACKFYRFSLQLKFALVCLHFSCFSFWRLIRFWQLELNFQIWVFIDFDLRFYKPLNVVYFCSKTWILCS